MSMSGTKRWTIRPEGSNWGDFGPDDELGRINLLTPQKVREGSAEIREGISFCLSLPLDRPRGIVLSQSRVPPTLRPSMRDGCPCFNFPMSRSVPRLREILSDDVATLSLQYSTHWDAFSHVGYQFDVDGDGVREHVYYNGFRANEHVVGPRNYVCDDGSEKPLQGALALDIAGLARKPIQGRAVMLDLRHHLGNGRSLAGYKEIAAIIEADGIKVGTGDIVVLRTGWTGRLMEMGDAPDMDELNRTGAVLDGRDQDLLRWITDSGIAAICADNYAVEALPSRDYDISDVALPLHEHCLFKLGIPLGELWALDELADWLRDNGRTAFFLTAPALYLPGAVGSPLTPVATV